MVYGFISSKRTNKGIEMFIVRVMTIDGILDHDENFSNEDKARDYFDDMLNTYVKNGGYVVQLIDESDNVIAEVL